MQKSVFRPNEIKAQEKKMVLPLTHKFEMEKEIVEEPEEPEYTGPTADDLRREAEAYKLRWATEKQKMIESAKEEAAKVVEDAKKTAFDEIKRNTNKAKAIKQQAEDEAKKIIQDAENKSLDIIQEAERKHDKEVEEAYKEGFSKGKEDGFQDGAAEAKRLVERMHTILDKTMQKRVDILDSTEQQIIELVLLMTKKVVKVLSESQRSVLMSNVVQALRKVKGRGDVSIHVNLADVKLTTEHTKDFIQAVENVQRITVIEDSTVEKGGCLVETDFGSIDARITSQLSELEKSILNISPIKAENHQNPVTLD
ncbi:MAG: flagellar assembly protein FliH [Treponema sp. CETP13]|nr:MAG: flagellar assembly protein FliH [Treponema sp. CETP13]